MKILLIQLQKYVYVLLAKRISMCNMGKQQFTSSSHYVWWLHKAEIIMDCPAKFSITYNCIK